MTALPLPSTILALVAVLVGTYIYKLASDPLRGVPGPFLARFTSLWELAQVRKSHFEVLNLELHKEYGSVVRLAPGRYSIDDVSAIKIIYGHGSKFTKSIFYFAFGSYIPSNSDLFSERDLHRHGQMRRKVASLFSMTTLLSYEGFVDKINAVLCDKLRDFAHSGTPFDVPKWMQFYAFDVIGEITVGESFGMLRNGRDDSGILQAIHKGSVYGSQVGLFGQIHGIVGRIVSALPGVDIPFNTVKAYIDKCLALRESGQQSSDREDFLSKLVKMRKAGNIDDQTVFTTIGANVAAGSDTTAISLSTLLRYLVLSPTSLVRLRAEMDECFQAGKLSDPVTFREASEMPYLQAAIKEAIRLHPATGQPLPRVVPTGGAQIAGKFFPAGAVVGVNPWVIHNNNDIYGNDASEFRPERWLVPAEKVSKLDAGYLSFGAGARTCLGKNISLLEIAKVVPQIFRQFDLTIEEGTKFEKENVCFVKPKFQMRVQLREDLQLTDI